MSTYLVTISVVSFLRWPRLAESVMQRTVWRPSVRLSVSPVDILAVTHQGAACDAASIHCGTTNREDRHTCSGSEAPLEEWNSKFWAVKTLYSCGCRRPEEMGFSEDMKLRVVEMIEGSECAPFWVVLGSNSRAQYHSLVGGL